MKYLDCNQIKIFINLEIIGEEKNIFFLNLKIFKNLCNLVVVQLSQLPQPRLLNPTFIIY